MLQLFDNLFIYFGNDNNINIESDLFIKLFSWIKKMLFIRSEFNKIQKNKI